MTLTSQLNACSHIRGSSLLSVVLNAMLLQTSCSPSTWMRVQLTYLHEHYYIWLIYSHWVYLNMVSLCASRVYNVGIKSCVPTNNCGTHMTQHQLNQRLILATCMNLDKDRCTRHQLADYLHLAGRALDMYRHNHGRIQKPSHDMCNPVDDRRGMNSRENQVFPNTYSGPYSYELHSRHNLRRTHRQLGCSHVRHLHKYHYHSGHHKYPRRLQNTLCSKPLQSIRSKHHTILSTSCDLPQQRFNITIVCLKGLLKTECMRHETDT